MNYYFYALLCYSMALFCIIIYGCYGQRFLPIGNLNSVQRTDKLDGTTDSPITDRVRISWSPASHEYRIHAIGNDNIETFHKKAMRVIFMFGDFVKIIVLDTENVWLCQFPSARWARQFYSENHHGESLNGVPFFDIDVVNVEVPRGRETFTDVALFMRPYGLPQSDSKMFVLKPSPRTGRIEPIFMMFLSGRFSIEKTGDRMRFTFDDVEDRSCKIVIHDNGERNVEMVYEAISRYARRTCTDDSGWVSNPRYNEFDMIFSPN